MTSTADRAGAGTVDRVKDDQLPARTGGSDADPPGWAVAFDARAVPCEPAAMRHVRDLLLLHSAHRSAAGVAFLVDLAAEVSTLEPDGAHRALLAAQRHVRRALPSLQSHLTAALGAVRRHSALYTARSCHCLAQAWEDWQKLAAQHLTALDAVQPMWAVERDGAVVHDMQGPLQVADLLTRAGAGWRAPRGPVHLSWSGTGQLTFSAAGRSYVLHRPTPEQARLVRLVRLTTVHRRSTATSWVRTWPPALGPVLTALAARPERALQAADDASDLLAAGIGDLDAGTLTVAESLAREWAGPAAALPAAAAAVVAPGPAHGHGGQVRR